MSGEKTEEPTEKRLEEHKRKGELPSRRNATEAILLTTLTIVIISNVSLFYTDFSAIMTEVVNGVDKPFEVALRNVVGRAADVILLNLALIGGSALLVLLSGTMFNKFNFASEAITFKFEKFNPATNAKQIFSKTTMYVFARLMVLLFTLTIVLYIVIKESLPEMLSAMRCPISCTAVVFSIMSNKAVTVILAVIIILALIDFKIQTKMFMGNVKMSKDDIKREYKNSEGDALIKGTRKRLAHEDAILPGIKDVTHVVYSQDFMVAMIFDDKNANRAPYCIMRFKGMNAPEKAEKFKNFGAKLIMSPQAASDLYYMSSVQSYMPPRSGRSMAIVLDKMERASK